MLHNGGQEQEEGNMYETQKQQPETRSRSVTKCISNWRKYRQKEWNTRWLEITKNTTLANCYMNGSEYDLESVTVSNNEVELWVLEAFLLYLATTEKEVQLNSQVYWYSCTLTLSATTVNWKANHQVQAELWLQTFSVALHVFASSSSEQQIKTRLSFSQGHKMTGQRNKIKCQNVVFKTCFVNSRL